MGKDTLSENRDRFSHEVQRKGKILDIGCPRSQFRRSPSTTAEQSHGPVERKSPPSASEEQDGNIQLRIQS